jgi:hypothetical protein
LLWPPGNFKRVKQGRTDDYQIRKYQSNVVADNFKFGTDRNVIVALEHDVFMVNKKQLQKVSHWFRVQGYGHN